ncbi:hypothetical protein KI688_004088 [Linnemannia hyalina]|uniref:Uncharacterized protein n=1 Tax=Linnemannia hyalina TaxID=64524 RepID=A0A9P7XQ75_9FUNG|nr:hypothetical protein KI688_004088 [Linnemannia hyalina]
MYTRNLVTLVLLALCALCSLSSVFAKPPPPPSNLITVTSPVFDSVYKVGKKITVKVKLTGGVHNVLYKDNTPIDIIIQKSIPMPNLNVKIATVPARVLADKGFKFVAKKEYIIPTQTGIRWRIRVSFDHSPQSGYSDSAGFFIVK